MSEQDETQDNSSQTPDIAPAASATPTPAAADTAPVKLPYGVEDVLKLSRAQVSEDVTLNFIHNSGTIYNLSPSDIVYLRNQGESDRVMNTMLDQRKNVPAEAAAQAAQSAAPATQPAPANPDANAAAAAQTSPQYAPAYVEPAPTYAPASTVYVIPYSSGGYYYPSYYPYYGGYYGYYSPSFVFSIGGRGHYGGYYHGGRYYGGGHSGGSHFGHSGHRLHRESPHQSGSGRPCLQKISALHNFLS